MESTANLCVLCCSSYGQSSAQREEQAPEEASALNTETTINAVGSVSSVFNGDICKNPHFTAFCREIESLSKDNLNLTQTNQNFSTNILLNSLDFFKRLSICTGCLSLISKVTDARVKTNVREENIRMLQLKILKELKELQTEISVLHDDMMSIEKIIASSDISCLENFLESFMPPKIEGIHLGDQKGNVHKASVILFRNNILAVVNEIRLFQERLTSKLSCSYIPSSSSSELKKRKYPKKKTKRSTMTTKVSHNDTTSGSYINPLEIVEVKTELSELGVNLQDNEDAVNSDDPMSGRISGARYGLRNKTFTMPELDINIGDDDVPEEEDQKEFGDDENDDDDVDFNETDFGEGTSGSEDSSEDSLSSAEYEPEPEPAPKKKSKKKKHNTDEKKSEITIEEQSKKKKKKWKKKKKEVPIPASVNLDKQSEFRRQIISRIYWRLEKHKNKPPPPNPKDSSKVDPDIDPRQGYVMEYNPDRKCLFVENVEVRFNDDSEILQCTWCPFQTGQNDAKFHRSADTIMFHHILGKHLEVYKCGECSQVLGSLKRWQDHIRGHQNQFVCDICSKPMYSSESLYNHRWSHMNAQEMEEAISKGMRDPRDKLQRMKERGALRAFICQICQKGFQTNFLLKTHEQIHREDRERIQCPICGKTFLPMGFYSHQKYTCRPDGSPIVYQPCHLCPGKFFKNKHLLKRHFDRTHSAAAETRPHICEICGRGFKTRGELGRHGNAHLETRPWVCGKGCGAAFKHKKNCTRHEGNCNGVVSSRGKPVTTATIAPSNSRSMYIV